MPKDASDVESRPNHELQNFHIGDVVLVITKASFTSPVSDTIQRDANSIDIAVIAQIHAAKGDIRLRNVQKNEQIGSHRLETTSSAGFINPNQLVPLLNRPEGQPKIPATQTEKNACVQISPHNYVQAELLKLDRDTGYALVLVRSIAGDEKIFRADPKYVFLYA